MQTGFARIALRWSVSAVFMTAVGTFLDHHPASAAEQVAPTHPAEAGQSAGTPAVGRAFEFAVPLLERDQPEPSYGPDARYAPPDSIAESDEVTEMNHSGHEMPAGSPEAMEGMEGMDHGQMPGMTHAPAEESQP